VDQKEYEEAKQRIQDNAGIPIMAKIGYVVIAVLFGLMTWLIYCQK